MLTKKILDDGRIEYTSDSDNEHLTRLWKAACYANRNPSYIGFDTERQVYVFDCEPEDS